MLINWNLMLFLIIVIILALIGCVIYGLFFLSRKMTQNKILNLFSVLFLRVGTAAVIFGGIFMYFWLIDLYPTVYIVDDEHNYRKKTLIGSYPMQLKNGETVLLTQKDNKYSWRNVSTWVVNNTNITLCQESVDYGSHDPLLSKLGLGNYKFLIFPYSVESTGSIDFILRNPPSSVKTKKGRETKEWLHFITEMNMQTVTSSDNTYLIDIPISLSKLHSSDIVTNGEDIYTNKDTSLVIKLFRENRDYFKNLSAYTNYIRNIATQTDNTVTYKQQNDITEINGYPTELFSVKAGNESYEIAYIDVGQFYYQILIFSNYGNLKRKILMSFKTPDSQRGLAQRRQ